MENWFHPNVNTVANLTDDLAAKLQRSLTSLIDAADLKKIEHLKCAKTFRSPYLHAINNLLIQKLTKKDPVDDILELAVPLNPPLKEEIDVSNFSALTGNQQKILTQSIEHEFSYVDLRPVGCEKEVFEKNKHALKQALDLLKSSDPEYHKCVTSMITDVVFNNNATMYASSSDKTFGLIYLKQLDTNAHWLEIFDFFVHETCHAYLHLLSFFHKLVFNKKDELYTSPIRPDPRPIIGIFHAYYVLTRLVEIFEKTLPLLDNKDKPILQERIERYTRHIISAYEILYKHGKFSEISQSILQIGIEPYRHLIRKGA